MSTRPKYYKPARYAKIAVELAREIEKRPSQDVAEAAISAVCDFHDREAPHGTDEIDKQAVAVAVYDDLGIDSSTMV